MTKKVSKRRSMMLLLLCLTVLWSVLSILTYKYSLYDDYYLNINDVYDIDENIEQKFNCAIDEWLCRIRVDILPKTEIKTCWNKLSPSFKNGYKFLGFEPFWDNKMRDFIFDCVGNLKYITLFNNNINYNTSISYTIFNVLTTDLSFKLFLNNKALKLYPQTYQWYYSELIALTNNNDRIRYIYNVTTKKDEVYLPDLKFNFIPLDENKNILSSAIWSLPSSFMQNIKCKNQMERYARKRGWQPCLDHMDMNNCIVYSIGVSAKNQFDKIMGQKGCKVYSFDCTVSYPHNMAENVVFYPWCVGDNKYALNFKTVENAKVISIIEIMDFFKHNDEDISIEILKIDCEGCEWSILNDLIQYKHGKYIKENKFKQLLIEFHVTHSLIQQSHLSLVQIYNLHKYFKHFKIYESNINPGGRNEQKLDDETLNDGFMNAVCCYEYHLMLDLN